MTPAIDIIVLNWNGKNDTIECLDSLRQSAYPNRRIIVVDNGSTDDSVAAIRRAHPDIKILCTGSNLGYAGGNNAGLRYCRATGKADFYLCLNNDTIVKPDLLECLVETAARNTQAALFSPKIFFHNKPEILWFAGGVWDKSAVDFYHLGYCARDSAEFGEKTSVDYVSGCALFMRAEVIDKIGFLDERYFLLFEEVDFCYRAQQQGFKCVVSTDAIIFHKVSSSIGASDAPLATYFYSRNRMLFSRTHLSIVAQVHVIFRVICETIFPQLRIRADIRETTTKTIYWLLMKGQLCWPVDYRSASYRAHILGLRDYVARRFGDCPKTVRYGKRRIKIEPVPQRTGTT